MSSMSLGTTFAPHLKLNHPSSALYLSTHLLQSSLKNLTEWTESFFLAPIEWFKAISRLKKSWRCQNKIEGHGWVLRKWCIQLILYFRGLWRRFPYPPTDAHLSQPVDNDTSILELVDEVLMEIGHLESRASKTLTIFSGVGTSVQMTVASNTWQAVICIPQHRDPFLLIISVSTWVPYKPRNESSLFLVSIYGIFLSVDYMSEWLVSY